MDRFLEHSRIFYFDNGGDPQVYIGSADWMDRNLSRRVEVVFPIEQPELKQRLIGEILATSLADNVKARELLPDGSYRRVMPEPGQPPVRSQQRFPGDRRVGLGTALEWTGSRRSVRRSDAHSSETPAARSALGMKGAGQEFRPTEFLIVSEPGLLPGF